jgi:hypothetical protein
MRVTPRRLETTMGMCARRSYCYPRPRLIRKVLGRGAQAAVRGGACCASQVLDRSAQVDARGATRLFDRGVQAVSRGAARCALHVHGRGAKADASGRSFAVLSTQVLTAGLRLRLVVPKLIPAAQASRCCRRRFQQLACACGTTS